MKTKTKIDASFKNAQNEARIYGFELCDPNEIGVAVLYINTDFFESIGDVIIQRCKRYNWCDRVQRVFRHWEDAIDFNYKQASQKIIMSFFSGRR